MRTVHLPGEMHGYDPPTPPNLSHRTPSPVQCRHYCLCPSQCDLTVHHTQRLLLVVSVPRRLVGFTPDSSRVFLNLNWDTGVFSGFVCCPMWFLKGVPHLLGNWIYLPLIFKVFWRFGFSHSHFLGIFNFFVRSFSFMTYALCHPKFSLWEVLHFVVRLVGFVPGPVRASWIFPNHLGFWRWF